jgi:hypothetical protein
MNTLNIKWQWAAVGLFGILAAGCGGSSGGVSQNATPVTLPSVVTTGSGVTTPVGSNQGVNQFAGQTGSAVGLTIDSNQALTNYVGVAHALNAPSNFALHVNLIDNGGGQFGGNINITYLDNGLWNTSNQQTGTGTVQISGHNWYNGLDNAAFNKWFTYGNSQVFHGFFQDGIGALVLVLDKTDAGTGDGLSSGSYSGSVWFKNFVNPANATQSADMCWFIEVGPFDCQTFMVGGKVSTTSALYPSTGDGYQRLGTFTGLNIKTAFNQ